MEKFITVLTGLLIFSVFSIATSLASGAGHSHGHHSTDSDYAVYKDSQGGIDAYLEIRDVKITDAKPSDDYLVKCDVRAYLQDSNTGLAVAFKRLALRTTVDHGKFGAAKAMVQIDEHKYGTDLFITEPGEHHYLLIADIPDVGSKQFHFHHVFEK